MGRKRPKRRARGASDLPRADRSLQLVEPARELDGDAPTILIEGCRSPKLLELVEKSLAERRAEEEDRRKTLDQKASTLLVALGVTASVSALSATAVPKLIEAGAPVAILAALVLAAFVTLVLGAAATLASVTDMKKAKAFVANEASIVDATSMRFYSKPENIDADPLLYRIVRVRDLLRLGREARTAADLKATQVERAQSRFARFVLSAFVTTAIVVAATTLPANEGGTMSKSNGGSPKGGSTNNGPGGGSSSPSPKGPSLPAIPPPQPLQEIQRGDRGGTHKR